MPNAWATFGGIEGKFIKNRTQKITSKSMELGKRSASWFTSLGDRL